MGRLFTFKVKNIDGEDVELSHYKGKVLLIVNVASKCGFTKQYAELEDLYKKHHDKGFEILGFPCNQFGNQEPGTENEIKDFCTETYGVDFPMFSKVMVNGAKAHPMYVFLKHVARGFLWSKPIKWNFTKFLVDKNGMVIKRYAPYTNPMQLEAKIIELITR